MIQELYEGNSQIIDSDFLSTKLLTRGEQVALETHRVTYFRESTKKVQIIMLAMLQNQGIHFEPFEKRQQELIETCNG